MRVGDSVESVTGDGGAITRNWGSTLLLTSLCPLFYRYNMKCKMKGMDIVDEETFKKTPAAAVKALLESYE